MSVPLAVDLETPVRNGLSSFATFVPRFLGFLIILIIGYFIAKLLAKLVDKGLEKAGFDRAVERGGIKKALASSSFDASDIVAKLVFLAVFIPFLSAAIGTLGIVALQQPLEQFIALIPKIIVAIGLVVIGAVVAGAVKTLIQNALGGLSYGKVLATVVSLIIVLGFVKAALDQVGIATTVTGPLLYAILGTVAGVVIVGAGGGLIKPMQGRWESMLNKAELETQNARAQVQNDARARESRPSTNPEPYPATTSEPYPATTGTDPATTGTDPATTGTDPATTGTDPATTGTDPSTTDMTAPTSTMRR